MPELIFHPALLSGSLHSFCFGDERLRCGAQHNRKVLSPSPSLDASDSSPPGPWTRCVTPPPSPLSPSLPSPSDPNSPTPFHLNTPVPGPLPRNQRAEAGGHGTMVASSRQNHLAMSSVTSPVGRVHGSNFTPHHYKPFRSHAHYQQVMRALHKLQESGFYWGAVGGREASSMLRSEPPGTFLIRDSSDHHYFFTLSVQTARGTKNLRIHSEGGGFFLQPDPQNTQELPQFDCVLKLIAHYMGKGPEAGRSREGACGGNSGEAEMKGRSVYLIHTGGERIPLELRRPLSTSLSSLQHMCRRTLNNRGFGESERSEQLPQTLKDFLEEYDAPI